MLAAGAATVMALAVAIGVLGCGARGSEGAALVQAKQAGARLWGRTVRAERRSSASEVRLVASGVRRRVTKLLVFVVENHSLAQMKAQMPFTYRLARRFGYASNYHAIRHPSLPNYLAIVGGATFGVTDDQPPAAHRIRARSVFGQALRHGRTAKVYAEGMGVRCRLADGGQHYAVRHNPWTYFVAERRQCRRLDVPIKALAGDVAHARLPNAGMVVPNLAQDAHDGTLAAADSWLQKRVNMIRRGQDWRSGRLAIVITADEDDHHHHNRVLTVVASRSSAHGKVVTRRLDHYSLTRLYDDILGVPRLRSAKEASSMTRAFRVPVG